MIIRSNDTCAAEFWYDFIEGVVCNGTMGGTTFTCKVADSSTCSLTITSTDFDWVMECEFPTQKCHLKFSRAWFTEGLSTEASVCEGECVFSIESGLAMCIAWGSICLLLLVGWVVVG
jgi:hypothetical protein